VDGVGELARLVHIRVRRLTPDDVGVGGVGQTAADGTLDAAVDVVEPLDRPVAIDERHIVGVNVRRQQLRAVGVGAGDEDVGTPITSAASRAATSFWTNSRVGTSTLPPMWPHFLADES
jgi:hypothetical protein